MSKFKIRHLFVLMMLLSVPVLLMAQFIPGNSTPEDPCPCGEDSIQVKQSSALRSAYIGAPPTVPNITPPSPESQALNKFLGYPVSHATGLVNVSIPVFNVEAGDFTIPLQLKYHSSGVKTQEAVGTVGRNWTLTPGFRISRTVFGKPDETYPVTIKPNGDYSEEDLILMCAPSGNEACTYVFDSRPARAIDGQYDVFTLHLPHTSVSFILQNNNGVPTVRMSPEKPLTITPRITNNRLFAFEVTDENGIKYNFGETSHTIDNGLYTETAGIPNHFCFSTWTLREAVLPGGEKVTFTYTKIGEAGRALSYNESILDQERQLDDGGGCPFLLGQFLGNPGYVHNRNSAGNSTTYSLVPASIVTPTQKVTFIYTDLTIRKLLSTVKVENYLGNQLRLLTLTYKGDNKLLAKATVSGEGSYTLRYKDETNTTIDSSGFDWWGYYNGTSTGGIPLIRTIAYGYYWHDPINIGNSAVNRNPDARYMDSRSLQEITYPTGGKFSIEYEPHRFKDYGEQERMGAGLRVKLTRLYDPVSGKTTTKTYHYEGAEYPSRIYPTDESLVAYSELCRLDSDGPVKLEQRVYTVFPSTHEINSGSMPVWYRKVTELSDNGKTDYEYEFSSDSYTNQAGLGGLYHVISTMYRLADTAPRLIRQTHYRKEGNTYTPVEETVNTYSSGISWVNGMVVIPYRRSEDGRSVCKFADTVCHGRWYDYFGSPVRSFDYRVALGEYRLASTEKKSYVGSSSLSEKTSYSYVSSRPYNLSEKRTLTSDGNEVIDKFYYVDDNIPNRTTLSSAQQTMINTMKTAGWKTMLVQSIREKNGSRLFSKLTGYNRNAGKFLPESEYYQKGTGSFERTFHCHNRDVKGNPVYVTFRDADPSVYVWGYRGRYPIAEIKGVTLSQVTPYLTLANMNTLSQADNPEGNTLFTTTLRGLRSRLPAAHIKLMTYRPGVGITRIDSPTGSPGYYTYDTAGRLIKTEVTGTSGSRQNLSEYIYRYINQ